MCQIKNQSHAGGATSRRFQCELPTAGYDSAEIIGGVYALTLKPEESSLCWLARSANAGLSGGAVGLDVYKRRDGDARTNRADNPSLHPVFTPGSPPSSGVCKHVTLQQAEACLKLINRDMMSVYQSIGGKNRLF